MDYLIDNAGFFEEAWNDEEYNALGKAVYSLEKWRDTETTRYLPMNAQHLIFFKQCDQCRA